MKARTALHRLPKAFIYVLLSAVLAFSAVEIIAVQAAATITLRAVSTANNGAGSTGLTIAKPTGVVAGDVMIAQVVVNTASTTITAPSCWTLVRSTASGSAVIMATYSKVAGSSETSSYKWTLSAAQPATGGISDYMGVDNSKPVDASSGKVNGNTATASFTQITTTVPNDMLLAFVGVSGNTTVTPPAGFVEDYDRTDTSSSNGKTAEVSHAVKSTTGTTSVASAKEVSLAVTNITQLVALRPAASGPTPTPGTTSTPTAGPTPTNTPASVVIAAVGDMECTTTNCQGVGINTMVANMAPAAFFPDGDLVFSGTATNYNTYYNGAFGSLKSISHPAVGNHDGSTAYYDYWDGVGVNTGKAGTRGQGWYSFGKGAWHIVVLNSNCITGTVSYQVSCAAGSPQVNWLISDLSSHTNKCTIAFMHIPYYTSGSSQFPELQTILQTLYQYHVDVLVTGHIHDYQRFYPQDGNGNRVSDGVTEFVVGTGGGTLASVSNTPSATNEAVQIGHAFGVLKMSLFSGSYSFQFLPAPGSVGSDSGSGTCH